MKILKSPTVSKVERDGEPVLRIMATDENLNVFCIEFAGDNILWLKEIIKRKIQFTEAAGPLKSIDQRGL